MEIATEKINVEKQPNTARRFFHFFRHAWTPWSEPYIPKHYFSIFKQHRRCIVCNFIEEKTVSTA